MVGTVPFVNGGIFERHRLETDYDPDIPDSAFGEMFDFFDGWRWHLDERPSEITNEINPDVLGYIFEQYINQKDYGAYYTKPDVTGYMATSAILPALADRFVAAGLGDPALLLAGSGSDYIHDSRAHGIDLPTRTDGRTDGRTDSGPDLPPVGDLWPWQWHSGDPAEYVELPPPSDDVALPGERWCDVVHRRERYARLLNLLSDRAREWSIDDAVTENLDLPGLLSDYLSQLRDAGECQRAFEVLSSLTVCDPTVGSGAFLFAALDVLEPLYGTLLARAEELDARGQQTPAFYAEARRHPSERYWTLKTICLRNLYGVDIMAEAPEVAKLRLFLKLAAQIDRVEDLEPLPDLDFNIKCGNLLVGVRDGDDALDRIAAARADGQLGLASAGRLDGIGAVATQMAAAYDSFVEIQSTSDHAGAAEAKTTLLNRSEALRADCDELLHGLREETVEIDSWRPSHQPFHWFIEFPSIWRNGGFDVIIGNPPYIQTKKVKGYRWVGYKTAKCPDLYAICMERSSSLLNSQGCLAMIVMHSLCFHHRFEALRHNLEVQFGSLWISSYSRASDSLFSGSAKVRNSICIARKTGNRNLLTTRCQRWLVSSRPQLLASLEYGEPAKSLLRCGEVAQWPFGDDAEVLRTFATLVNTSDTIGAITVRHSDIVLGFKTTAGVQPLGVYVTEPPTVSPSTGEPAITSSQRSVWFRFENQRHRDIALMSLAGRWGYLWWLMFGDEFHVTLGTLAAFPGDIERIAATTDESGNRTEGDMELVRLLDLSRRVQSEMLNHVEYNLRGSGGTRVLVGRYMIGRLRHLTDQADWLLSQAWGLSQEQFEAAGNLRDRMIFGNKE